jgi:hypothetical protein
MAELRFEVNRTRRVLVLMLLAADKSGSVSRGSSLNNEITIGCSLDHATIGGVIFVDRRALLLAALVVLVSDEYLRRQCPIRDQTGH